MSAGVKHVSTGYVARPLQLELHKKLKRFSVIVCHRRFGKTVFAINHMIARAMKNPRLNPRYAYLAPLYSQAKRVAWDYLKHYTSNLPGVVVNEADLRIDIHRPATADHPADTVRFQLLGADNPMSLKGIYLDGVILDEYGEMNPTAWREVIRPTLSDRMGWAIFIGTPKGQNSFFDLFTRARDGFQKEDGALEKSPEWFAAIYRASETGIIPDAELASARTEMTEEEYEQEFECSFVAGLVGAYFARELARVEKDGRIMDVPYEPTVPVDTFWDLGVNDTTVVWFVQSINFGHRILDHYEVCGLSIPEIVADIRKKPYAYGKFYLPHDAAARDLSTGKSREQVFRSLGVRNIRILPRQEKRDQINAARMIFTKCWFDKTKCAKGLRALQNYQRKWNAKNNVFEDAPLHNWASNSADAFQQFAIGVREHHQRESVVTQTQAVVDYNPYGVGRA